MNQPPMQPPYYPPNQQQQFQQPQFQQPPIQPMAPIGFFQGLLDFRFKHRISVRVASFLYILTAVFMGLATVIVMIAGVVILFNSHDVAEKASGVACILLSPFSALFNLVLIRMMFETAVVFFQMADSLQSIDAKLTRQ